MRVTQTALSLAMLILTVSASSRSLPSIADYPISASWISESWISESSISESSISESWISSSSVSKSSFSRSPTEQHKYYSPDLNALLRSLKYKVVDRSGRDICLCISYCLKLLPAYSTDYISTLRVELEQCLGYLQKELVKAKVIADYGKDPWSDVFNKPRLTAVAVEREEKNETMRGCQIDMGSITAMPSLRPCIWIRHNSSLEQEKMTTEACDNNTIMLTSCEEISAAIVHYQTSWSLAKFNYGLVLSTTLFVLLPTSYRRLKESGVGGLCGPVVFGPFNMMWMMWRLQETVNAETNWQRRVPYVCVATNTARYVIEGMSLFLFAWTSVERYQSLAGALLARLPRKNKRMLVVASVVGAMTGLLCSGLNVIALHVMGQRGVLRTCSVQHHGANANLVPLIIVKVVSLLALYLVPCTVMFAANIAMSTSVTRTAARPPLARCHSRKPAHGKKTRLISGFLVFSSLFMVCCVSKPVFEVCMALRLQAGVGASPGVMTEDRVGMLLDAVTWNLTTVAYVINTLLGIRYTK